MRFDVAAVACRTRIPDSVWREGRRMNPWLRNSELVRSIVLWALAIPGVFNHPLAVVHVFSGVARACNVGFVRWTHVGYFKVK